MSITDTPPPRVMIIGHGFMGDNHRKKIEALEINGKAKLVGVVDCDSERLTNLNVPTYHSVEKAYKESLPDIIAICANTKIHAALLEQVHSMSKKFERMTHILVEKPLVANSQEGEVIQKLYTEHIGCLSSGYLFRQSPIVSAGINYLNEHSLGIKRIQIVWQKDRMQKGPLRPSEGVHIDEATHPFDLIVNCILPQVGVQVNGVTLLSSSCKKQSEAGQIVDQNKQKELYSDDPSKLDPIAEVEYEMDVAGIRVIGLSSFVRAPQRREIMIECNNETTLCFEFDLSSGDRLSKIEKNETIVSLCEEKVDKLMLEWESFLDYCATGEKSYRIQTFPEMLFDVRLTEAIGQNLEIPTVIN